MYNGLKVLDIHQHVNAPVGTRAWIMHPMGLNDSHMRSPLLSGGSRGGGLGRKSGMEEEDFLETNTWGLKYMQDRNVDAALLGPRPYSMLGFIQPYLMQNWAEFVNDTIYIQCRNFPENYVGAAMLPQIATEPDLSHCIPELERCVHELGFKAVYLSPDPTGRRDSPGMDRPYWYPVYEKCQELNIPIIVHGTNCLDPRLHNSIPANYQVGFVWEQYLAWLILGHSDVFDRFPELRVCVVHAGGALSRFIKTDNHNPQRDLSRNLFFDTCVYDEDLLTAAIKQRGVDSMLFGSEAPGSGGTKRPETGRTSDDLVPVIAGFDWLTEEDKKKIFNYNVAKFCPGLAEIGVQAAAGD
jgi:predicted TIM-barrel fold metal-dependent hydrolase